MVRNRQERLGPGWWSEYGIAMHDVFTAIEADLGRRRRDVADRVRERLDRHLRSQWHGLPLSHKAVLTLLSLPITSVLVGMRRPG